MQAYKLNKIDLATSRKGGEPGKRSNPTENVNIWERNQTKKFWFF